MCKCVPYLIIVCDMGVGVNARGSDGHYATVYRWCFLFYCCQCVSYSIYCIFEEFHSTLRDLIRCHLLWLTVFLKLDGDWNETLHFSIAFSSQKCDPAVFVLGNVEQIKNTFGDCRHSSLTASVLCHFPLGVTFLYRCHWQCFVSRLFGFL